jgi:transcriptional regulator GlxA family with amidase domain
MTTNATVRDRDAPARLGVIIYDGVEPIDVGGTIGVISMAQRILPKISYAVMASTAGPVRLAGGLVTEAAYGVDDPPACEVYIVCGGAGWPDASRDPRLVAFLRGQPAARLASVCTGAMILAAAGTLEGRTVTTRRMRVGAETHAPLDLLAMTTGANPKPAVVIDDVVVTGGGVSLAIDTTLYLIGKFYGEAARDEVARVIEYDRAFAANRAALGVAE